MADQTITPIKWKTEIRRLGDLIKWEQNPRRLTKDQAVRLRRSIADYGYSQLYEIEPDNTIIDGHQRDEVMLRMDEFGGDAEIEVRVASRKLTLAERKEYIALKHKGAVGEWDWGMMLEMYNFGDLVELGFSTDELILGGFEDPDQLDNIYTRNIKAPIYEIKGEDPEIATLYDREKTDRLIAEIEAAAIPDDIREFLRNAAYRHTVFNYENIAEFYAHASMEVQELMENSALVIIDFARAIELGYVRLSEQIVEQYRQEHETS